MSDDASTGDDDRFLWHHCGSIKCYDGITRHIFVHCDDAPGTASDRGGFGLILLPEDAAAPDGAPTSGSLLSSAREMISELRIAGQFTAEEQSAFAAHVETIGRVDCDAYGSASAADTLFDEVLSQELGGWKLIGSRSGGSLGGPFRTTIYARQHEGGPVWTVLERSSDANSSCTIRDDGSGRTIFEQFKRKYYSEEFERSEDEQEDES
jgi:hypothetical protein